MQGRTRPPATLREGQNIQLKISTLCTRINSNVFRRIRVCEIDCQNPTKKERNDTRNNSRNAVEQTLEGQEQSRAVQVVGNVLRQRCSGANHNKTDTGVNAIALAELIPSLSPLDIRRRSSTTRVPRAYRYISGLVTSILPTRPKSAAIFHPAQQSQQPLGTRTHETKSTTTATFQIVYLILKMHVIKENLLDRSMPNLVRRGEAGRGRAT